jgi:hypothetical protein
MTRIQGSFLREGRRSALSVESRSTLISTKTPAQGVLGVKGPQLMITVKSQSKHVARFKKKDTT